MSIDLAYQILYSAALLVLGCLIALMLFRSVMGPRITDRLLSINMIGTMVISSLAILSQMLGEGYLADVALIYAMISFISVLILSRTYIPADPDRASMGEAAFLEAHMAGKGLKEQKKGMKDTDMTDGERLSHTSDHMTDGERLSRPSGPVCERQNMEDKEC